jgi:hypothetical protein
VRVPDERDWQGYESDLDVRYLHKLVFGKPIAEVIHLFRGNSIERMDELLFAPRRVFQYYVHAFGQYVMSEEAAGESDAASPFLALLEEREKRDPDSVREIFASLEPYVDFIGAGQEYFDAPEDIYGNFRERAQGIRRACTA